MCIILFFSEQANLMKRCVTNSGTQLSIFVKCNRIKSVPQSLLQSVTSPIWVMCTVHCAYACVCVCVSLWKGDCFVGKNNYFLSHF